MQRLALVLVMLGLAACTRPNDAFCCLSAASCGMAPGGDQPITSCTDPDHPFCTDFSGTDGPKWTCVADPMAMSCSLPSDCTSPDRPLCLDQRCVQCEADTDCAATTPVCSATHLCDLCSSDDDCAARTGATRCSMTSGACVGCVDSTQCADPHAPVCDGTSNSCRGCASDSECPSDVCDTSSGECVDEASVIYLSTTGQPSGTCTKSTPCTTFALGLGQVSATRDVIKAAPGTYTGAIVVAGATTVTIFGAGVTATVSTTNQSVVDVSNGANVTLDGLTIEGAGGTTNPAGVHCSQGTGVPATLHVRDATIQSNGGAGIAATDCDVSVDRSIFKTNNGGGISLASSTYSLMNDFIVGNGNGGSTFGGVDISGVATAGTHVFEFNTVAANVGIAGANTGVDCVSVFVPLSMANSIVYGNSVSSGGAQIGGDSDCTATFSDVGPDAAAGTGNIDMLPMFVDGSGSNGDFHLLATSPAKDVADPNATVMIDIDGDTRPQGAGYDMGADEVTP